ncbi:SDR family oxidoreductase [Sphingomonas sp.]|uniref:dTDP-4-dehydrorhamnose reductase family protein n=1 Tax=Sphingomonas sp. TaxID=28214 RepID=UPI0025D43DAD|nr:SDR family oxidoreductase [Sphingomonas sp.]
MRYLVSWERLTETPETWDNVSSDLNGLRQKGVRPIIGLVHHGSGPPTTDLLSHCFATGLAAHARTTVERFPWVMEWTPVNEPLTTARFAALYGLWFPHHRDERSFWIALLNQVDATRLAMREIRAVNPQALLVQTEDLGRTYATAALGDQSGFDNTRRWMTWDLLAGRVNPAHPFWDRLVAMGLGDRLRVIADDPCPADIIGVNHYLTSDRFLDHRTHLYPAERCGSNASRRYADVEAIRVLGATPAGLRGALDEAWTRYGKPIAVTECHNACTREEQMRWTAEAWAIARSLRARGVDIVAVTAWAAAGSRNWSSLLTRDDGLYECGAFDSRSGALRSTAMVPLLRELASDSTANHPVVAAPGWWRRTIRFAYPALGMATPVALASLDRDSAGGGPPILIAGGTGTLGQAIAQACHHRGLRFVLTTRADLDVTDAASIDDALARFRPWAVINATGWVRVDDAETQVENCRDINVTGAALLARACEKAAIHYTALSSDLVFDGTKQDLYVEDDAPAPLGIYGQTKAEAEAGAPHGLTIRTAAFFSPNDAHNFAVAVRDTLRAGQVFEAAADYFITPTYVPDLVANLLDLVIDREVGIWHLSNGEAVSWAEFAGRIAKACALPVDLLSAVPGDTLGWTALRPRNAGLGTSLGVRMPTLGDAIDRFAAASPSLPAARQAA